MISPLATHPVTSRVVLGGLTTTIFLLVAERFGIPLSEWEASLIVTFLSGVIAFIGRDGLVGAWHKLLHGTT